MNGPGAVQFEHWGCHTLRIPGLWVETSFSMIASRLDNARTIVRSNGALKGGIALFPPAYNHQRTLFTEGSLRKILPKIK